SNGREWSRPVGGDGQFAERRGAQCGPDRRVPGKPSPSQTRCLDFLEFQLRHGWSFKQNTLLLDEPQFFAAAAGLKDMKYRTHASLQRVAEFCTLRKFAQKKRREQIAGTMRDIYEQ